LLVALGAGEPDRGPARGVEQAKLDANRVSDFAHDAPESVDFTHEVAFGDAAYGRVTRHLRDQVDIERVKGSLEAHAGGGHGSFAAGVSSADYYYVEFIGELHGSLRRAKSTGEDARRSSPVLILSIPPYRQRLEEDSACAGGDDLSGARRAFIVGCLKENTFHELSGILAGT